MNYQKKPIKIIGAGISGLSAAITLRKAGYEVVVYEKNSDVGKRFHGDMQGFENWSEEKDILEELKEIGIKINFDCHGVNKIISTNTKEKGSVKNEKPVFYLIKRVSSKGNLDYSLKQQALSLGVKIIFNKTIKEENADIVATGPSFIPEVFDKGIVFKTDLKDIAVILLDNKFAHNWYAYLLVDKGYGCLCTVTDDVKDIENEFEKTKKFFVEKYNLKIKDSRRVGGIGNFYYPPKLDIQYKKHETLFVGERAGLQDLFLGFGMRYAFESGYIAARSIIENKNYERLAMEKFSKKMKASLVNRYIFQRFNKFAIKEAVSIHTKHINKNLHSIYNYNLSKKLLYPFAKRYLNKLHKGLIK